MKALKKFLSIFKILPIALCLLLIAAAANRVAVPWYQDRLGADMLLTVTATAKNQDDALSNNVRLRSVVVNGQAINLGQVPLTGAWQYEGAGDFLYAYDLEGPSSLDIPLEQVRTLSLTFVSERGSGIVTASLDGKTFIDTDLYSDEDWKLVSFDRNLYPVTDAESSLDMVKIAGAAALVLAILLYILARRRETRSDMLKSSLIHLLHMALALLIVVSCYLIQYQTFDVILSRLKSDHMTLVRVLILVWLILETLYFLLRRTYLAYFITAGVLEFMTAASYVKTILRESPLLPWDFKLIREASSVVNGYSLEIPRMTILILASVVVMTVLLFLLRWRPVFRVLPFLLTFVPTGLVLVIYVYSSFIQGPYVPEEAYRSYLPKDYYEERGFLTAFTEYLYYLLPQEAPEGYSKEYMQAMADKARNAVTEVTIANVSSKAAAEKPNIIVVMSESYFDLTRQLKHITFQEDPLPVLHALTRESLYGTAFSHVFGGNTVVSEFECLTGFSGEFFPMDYMVYGSFITEGFDSAVSILEAQGYHSMAFHPYLASNYNRDHAYKSFGFNELFFEESFPEDAKRARGLISDEALYDLMEEKYENWRQTSDEPLFAFAVTMQNHGGYWADSIYPEGEVAMESDAYSDTTWGSIKDYVYGLHESDRAFGEFVDYFRNVPEDTIIVYFGDHMSDAGSKADKMFGQEEWANGDAITYDFNAHQVPFVIWSNFDNTSRNVGLIGISQILPTAFDYYGLQKPAFWDFLIDMYTVYRASDSIMVVDPRGNFYSLPDMPGDIKTWYDTYKAFQYDYIWGKRYASDIFKI